MYKYFVIYNILLITFIQGSTIPAAKEPVKTLIDNVLSAANINKTNQAITEGGTVVASNPVTLLNGTIDNVSLSKNLDKDLSGSKGKSVVPRKGVVYNAVDDTTTHDKIEQHLDAVKTNNVTSIPVEIPKSNKATINETTTLNSTQKLNVTKTHKPLILSHEALAKMDALNHLDLDENGPDIKINSMKVGSHPGMIMPIVITILVVPMFAVLGYLAIKRGQEAWKNRHYKRMDFLLDGMYND